MNTAVKLYSLGYNNYRTYLFSALFITGNLVLPQIAHLVPRGGFIFLPIYFFTLIAAYKYGLMAGLLTAVLSPFLNHLLFGMPPVAVLPIIFTKSIILAIAAVIAARYFRHVSLVALFFVVFAYQFAGTMIEWAMVKDFYTAMQDIRIGFPGILLQIFGGYLLLRALAKY